MLPTEHTYLIAMNGDHPHNGQDHTEDSAAPADATPKIVLHRLGQVRRKMGLSWFELARRMGFTAEEIRRQEEADDVSISTLKRWSAALGVQITDLIVEPEEWLNAAHLEKPQAERLLRLAIKLRDHSRRRSIQRLAQTFVDQLTEMHPGLSASSNGKGRRSRQLLPKPRGNGSHAKSKRRDA
jgi:transcriptional regulator with XRE-family HTH domain